MEIHDYFRKSSSFSKKETSWVLKLSREGQRYIYLVDLVCSLIELTYFLYGSHKSYANWKTIIWNNYYIEVTQVMQFKQIII